MRDKKFIVTEELGKLAKWLRILGYDTVYHAKEDIPAIVVQALREGRIILTRSSTVANYKGVQAVVVKHDLVEDQMDQVMNKLGLSVEEASLFQICVECNTALEVIPKEDVKGKIPEYVYETQNEFKRCPQCDKIFWKGTHWDMVKKWLDKRQK